MPERTPLDKEGKWISQPGFLFRVLSQSESTQFRYFRPIRWSCWLFSYLVTNLLNERDSAYRDLFGVQTSHFCTQTPCDSGWNCQHAIQISVERFLQVTLEHPMGSLVRFVFQQELCLRTSSRTCSGDVLDPTLFCLLACPSTVLISPQIQVEMQTRR